MILQQYWDTWHTSAGSGNETRTGIYGRPDIRNTISNMDIVDTASAGGAPAKNCSGPGCCIPKCFAEKGARVLN